MGGDSGGRRVRLIDNWEIEQRVSELGHVIQLK